MFYILLIISCILLYYFLWYRPNTFYEKRQIPYYKSWPLVGDMLHLFLRTKSMADIIQMTYKNKEGRYFGTWSFFAPTLFVKDIELIKKITVKEFDHFMNHQNIVNADFDPLFAKNLFGLQDQEWREMRATLSPAFTGSKMRSMFILMSEAAQQFTEYFEQTIKDNETLTLEMKDAYTRYTNDVIASCAFGIKCDSLKERENDFYMMGKTITKFGGSAILKLFAFDWFPTLMKLLKVKPDNMEAREYFISVISNNIKEREEHGIVRPDLIHLLLEARKGRLKHEEKSSDDAAGFATVEESQILKETVPTKKNLTDDDITAQALIFFFAGFETVSIVLSHIVYELAQNVDVQTKLQEEIDNVLKKSNGKITYEELVKMKYMDMVVSEGLRKWPPAAATDRLCKGSYTIEPESPEEVPITLNHNESVTIPIYPIHRDPKFYPNPEKFDPERFSEENKHNIISGAYMPFGMGPRNCIASRFGLLEVKTMLFHSLSKFDYVVVEKSEIPITISKSQFNMSAENGFWLGLRKRNI